MMKPHFLSLFLALLIAPAVRAAGPLSIGVKGGVPLTYAFSDNTVIVGGVSTRTFSDTRNYVIGPMAELRFPFGLGVEADLLFRPLNFASTLNSAALPIPTRTSKNGMSWEFPIVAKYRVPSIVLHPYVEAGPSFRKLSGSLPYSAMSSKGIAFGGGLEVDALLVHISPELRFTRWGADSTMPASQPASSNRNQVEFLVGVTF